MPASLCAQCKAVLVIKLSLGAKRKPRRITNAVSVVLREPKTSLAGDMCLWEPLFRVAPSSWLLSIDRAMEGGDGLSMTSLKDWTEA
jgi:hypothetical protein